MKEEQEGQEEGAEQACENTEETPKSKLKKSDIGIFVFLGMMLLLVLAVIGFVIYINMGSLSGCNCPQCK